MTDPARKAAIHVALPLSLGALSYVLLRPSALAAHVALRHFVPSVVRGSLADGLWAYALGAAISLVWSGGSRRGGFAWLGAGLALALGFEALQKLGLVRGVFDARDLAFMFVGYLLGVALTRLPPTTLTRRAETPSGT